MSKLGFPTIQGAPVGPVAENQLGIIALRNRTSGPPRRSDVSCPICEGPLFLVPREIVMGRCVAIEGGVAAIDPLPSGVIPLYCRDCTVTFYGRE